MPNAFETAVAALIDGYRADRAGTRGPTDIDQKIAAARQAGHKQQEITNEADRRWGAELIANADRNGR
ncbi:hypothetical protein [Streptomyces sp. NPDC058202]|uniref:hypothetical protein n=1 Tax=Streptomyces sp. NPDC058202 TaxID=3346380 RepID=UPI0036E9EBEC